MKINFNRFASYVAMVLMFGVGCTQYALAQNQWKTVGNLVNGIPNLTLNKAQTLKDYNAKLFQASGINGNFTDVRIELLPNQEYSLVFIGSVYKSSLYVRLVDGATLYQDLSDF